VPPLGSGMKKAYFNFYLMLICDISQKEADMAA
jgi:hypothetical protein